MDPFYQKAVEYAGLGVVAVLIVRILGQAIMAIIKSRDESSKQFASQLITVIENNTTAITRLCDASEARGTEHAEQVNALTSLAEAIRQRGAEHVEQSRILVDVAAILHDIENRLGCSPHNKSS